MCSVPYSLPVSYIHQRSIPDIFPGGRLVPPSAITWSRCVYNSLEHSCLKTADCPATAIALFAIFDGRALQRICIAAKSMLSRFTVTSLEDTTPFSWVMFCMAAGIKLFINLAGVASLPHGLPGITGKASPRRCKTQNSLPSFCLILAVVLTVVKGKAKCRRKDIRGRYLPTTRASHLAGPVCRES